MRKLGKQELIHLAHGAIFLGGGGGGSLEPTLKVIDEFIKPGTDIDLVTVDEAAADGKKMTFVSTFIGSQSAATGATDPTSGLKAAAYMEKLVQQRYGKSIGYVVPVELGAQSSVIPACVVAVIYGWALVDADGAARAVPAVPATTYADLLDAAPTIVADDGLKAVIDVDDTVSHPERPIVRVNRSINAIARYDKGDTIAGIAMWPMDGKQVTSVPIQGTLSLAIDVGKALVDAQNSGSGTAEQDVLAVLKAHRLWAKRIAKGKLKKVTEPSPDYARVLLKGGGDKVELCNAGETMMARSIRHDRILALAPDSICYMTRKGRPFSNTEVRDRLGEKVIVIGIEARDPLQTSMNIREIFKYFRAIVCCEVAYTRLRDLSAVGPGRKITLRPHSCDCNGEKKKKKGKKNKGK